MCVCARADLIVGQLSQKTESFPCEVGADSLVHGAHSKLRLPHTHASRYLQGCCGKPPCSSWAPMLPLQEQDISPITVSCQVHTLADPHTHTHTHTRACTRVAHQVPVGLRPGFSVTVKLRSIMPSLNAAGVPLSIQGEGEDCLGQ